MKVAKFGGSSVANAEQLIKVGNIIKSDPKRKFIVVSAPGKRFAGDAKMTDMLIQLGEAFHNEDDYELYLSAVMARFSEIIEGLRVNDDIYAEIETGIKTALAAKGSMESKMDAIKATGEDSSAKILSAYLNSVGLSAYYINPQEAGIIVSDEPGNARILPESFDKIYSLHNEEGILVIPGFFGYTKEGKLATFFKGRIRYNRIDYCCWR